MVKCLFGCVFVCCVVDGFGQLHDYCCCRFGFDGQIGEYVHYGRLIEQVGVEHTVVCGVMDGVGDADAYVVGCYDRVVQVCYVDYLDDGFHVVVFFVDEPVDCVFVFDLGRRIGFVVEFVFQLLHEEWVACCVWQDVWDEEVGQVIW